MKQVFTNHDIKILTTELQYLIGARLNQVYDINNRSICLKLNKDKNKHYLILESGAKFYTVSEFSSIRNAPSSFSSKLRKHLNNKRISKLYQLRGDRVLCIDFGENEYKFSVYLEIYASGNIILIDNQNTILNLLHTFTYNEENKVKVKQQYPIEFATIDIDNYEFNINEIEEWFRINLCEKKEKLKNIFNKSQLGVYGPIMIDHVATLFGYNIKNKVNKDFLEEFTNEQILKLSKLLKQEYSKEPEKKGYIMLDDNNNYCSFEPILYEHKKNNKYIEFDSFEEACNTYFKNTDSKKFENKEYVEKIKKKELNKDKEERKLININNQIDSLKEKQQEKYNISDELINYINIIDMLLKDVYTLIKNKDTDLIKDHIKDYYADFKYSKINYDKNKIYLKFNNVDIDFDYTLNAFKNINNNYQTGKHYKTKINRALNAKKDIEDSYNKNKKKEIKKDSLIDIPGKTVDLWFEKYNWFISSDGFLVISGKSADQNEEIVKKYMDKNDIYVHSDVAGSGSGIIKNPKGINIPEITLEQAGHYIVCKTKTWLQGTGDRSWWVYPNQVSKTTESGEYITKGSFIIRGKKNYISYAELILGLTVMYKIKGNPNLQENADKNVEFGIPMCAPYKGLKNIKKKVKLVPGNCKINKVIKETISILNKKSTIYEQSAIKKITMDEFHRVLINKIKLS